MSFILINSSMCMSVKEEVWKAKRNGWRKFIVLFYLDEAAHSKQSVANIFTEMSEKVADKFSENRRCLNSIDFQLNIRLNHAREGIRFW